MKFTKPNSSRPSRSGKPNGGGGGARSGAASSSSMKKPLRAVRALKQADNSVLRPPVETSVSGLKQAVRLFETSTPEVVHLMSFECDIIYECRVCKNLFRSVANFISHKRVYCTRRFNHVQNSQVVEDHTLLVEGGGVGNTSLFDEQCLQLPARITARQDLTTIVQQASMAQYYREAEDKATLRDMSRSDATVHLQPIDNTTYGVYQTFATPGANASSLMKDQVSELQNIMMMREGVTLGPDGKILQDVSRVTPATPKKVQATPKKQSSSAQSEEHILSNNEHICALCKMKFSSKKTLSHHTRNAHNSFRVAYTCPCCNNLFTNTWSVLRHMGKVHRKTHDQVRRLRTQIQKKQVHTDKLTKKSLDGSKNSLPDSSSNNSSPSSTSGSNHKRPADSQEILDSPEVVKKGSSEVIRCAGCRRQFEKQAAFLSHSQICHKRRALCNSGSTTPLGGTAQSKHDKSKLAMKSQSHSDGSSEKRIGIQVRMNYCKSAVATSASPSSAAASPVTSAKSRRSDRHKNDSFDRSSSMLLSPADIKLEAACSPNSIESAVATQNGRKSAANNSASIRSRTESKQKLKKIESISRLLMEAVGSDAIKLEIPSIAVNGLSSEDTKHCDDDNIIKVPRKVAGDKFSSSACSSSSIVDVSKCDTKVGDMNNEKPVRLVTRSRYGSRLSSVDTLASSKDDESARDVKHLMISVVDCASLSVEVNGIHSESPSVGAVSDDGSDKMTVVSEKAEGEEQSQLSPAKEGVIRVLTRYQLKSICKKEDDPDVKKEEGAEEVEEERVPEEVQLERLRELFRNYIHYKTLQCLVCHEKMKNIVDLKNHVADHFGCNQFRCTFGQCSYVTFARSECVRHLTRTHLKQSERHLAVGFIGRISDTTATTTTSNSVSSNQTATADVEKGSARRKRSTPVKKDTVAADATVQKRESVASEAVAESASVASSPLKMKSNKRRKLPASVADSLPESKCSPDSTTATSDQSVLNDNAQSQPVAGKDDSVAGVGRRSEDASGTATATLSEEGVEVMSSESEDDLAEKKSTGDEMEVDGEEGEGTESSRSFRGFADCTSEEVARMESRRSTTDGLVSAALATADDEHEHIGLPSALGDNCNIRTMVMNVIFGIDQVTNTTPTPTETTTTTNSSN